MCARCSEIFSASSATPSPLAASVRTIGTRHEVAGPSESTPRISRIIVSVIGWSALLTTMMSGISITPAFSAWIESPEPGHQDEDDRVAVVDDVDLGLADADRLDEDVVLARGVHQQRRLQRGLGEAAEGAAARHRADEDPGVEEVVGEADAVAEQGAAGERARGVDREHGDLAVGLPHLRCQGADQGALPHPGRPGQPDDPGPAGPREDLANQLPAGRVVVLDQGDRARQRPLVAGDEPLGEALFGPLRHPPQSRSAAGT